MSSKMVCVVAVFFLVFFMPARSSNINIDDTCPRTNQGCMQCLSRNSDEIERCQQLFFYVSYATEVNQSQIDSYCTGDCPILLTTSYFYCDSEVTIPELFSQCPSYSVGPIGSFSVDVTYDNNEVQESCLNSSESKCLQCIGKGTEDAVRCLQAYLLARYSNSSSSYSSDYCNSNCPLVLQSFTWYCGRLAISEDAFNFCERSGSMFCGDLLSSSDESIKEAASSCSGNCTSASCSASISKFGCCLRQELGNDCENIPHCNLDTTGTTQNIVITGDCTFASHNCTQCLSRSSDKLEECEQLYTYITRIRLLRPSFVSGPVQEFCSGECPILLRTSDYFCSSSSRPFSDILQICPSYNVIPSATVDIAANFSAQNCLQGKEASDLECIAARSPEPTKCLQLFLLASEDTGSDMYIKEFCSGNCPLTLATSQWYYSARPQSFFYICNNTRLGPGGQYCGELTRNYTEFNLALSACRSGCDTKECAAAKDRYECCLSVDGEVNFKCRISKCSVRTAGAPDLLPTSSSLMVLTSASIILYLSR